MAGNIICGQVNGKTARLVADRFPRIRQPRTSLSINSFPIHLKAFHGRIIHDPDTATRERRILEPSPAVRRLGEDAPKRRGQAASDCK